MGMTKGAVLAIGRQNRELRSEREEAMYRLRSPWRIAEMYYDGAATMLHPTFYQPLELTNFADLKRTTAHNFWSNMLFLAKGAKFGAHQ
ncbi:hypothetical protein HPP92_009622 [Vanilla planifolia]|uniref:Uncharacterized protein n=1 Tax=Vanilla planifolia TaxID=51239 RepID=A0A835V5M0_VANPL|nr:hypothetical protein HPP92_009622 [Vanilla planifolia]